MFNKFRIVVFGLVSLYGCTVVAGENAESVAKPKSPRSNDTTAVTIAAVVQNKNSLRCSSELKKESGYMYFPHCGNTPPESNVRSMPSDLSPFYWREFPH